MTVTLNEQTRELLEAELKGNGFTSADEMVNRIVQEHLTPVVIEDEELEASLIAALEGPRHVYTKGDLLKHLKRRLEARSAESA